MPPKMSKLAARIEEFRLAARLSQTGLSAKAGLSPSAINNIMSTPERSPRLTTVQAIAAAMGVRVSDLIGESDDDGDEVVNPIPNRAGAIVAASEATVGKITNFAQALPGDFEFYLVRDCGAAQFGIDTGDVLVVDASVRPKSGEKVVAEIATAAGGAALVTRYVAEPYLFGFDASGSPVHDLIDGNRVRIRGRIIAVISIYAARE